MTPRSPTDAIPYDKLNGLACVDVQMSPAQMTEKPAGNPMPPGADHNFLPQSYTHGQSHHSFPPREP